METQSEYTFFQWDGEANSVSISGSFTNWKPQPLTTRSSSGGFFEAFKLHPGIHTYLFFVNNTEWHTDPANTLELSEDGYSQKKIYPRLPQHIPLSFQNRPFAHLYLRFDPSTINCIQDCVCGAGYARHLVSIVVLDSRLASSCALMWPRDIMSQALEELNGLTLAGEHTLQALEFAPTSTSDATAIDSGGSTRVLVGPSIPAFINKQHLMEHFKILVQRIDSIEPLASQNYSFLVIFMSLESAKEAVSIFNRSLLKGIQISLSYDESYHPQESLYQHRTLEATSMHTALLQSGLLQAAVQSLPQTSVRQKSYGEVHAALSVSQTSARQIFHGGPAQSAASTVSQTSARQMFHDGPVQSAASSVSQTSARQMFHGGPAQSAASSVSQTSARQMFHDGPAQSAASTVSQTSARQMFHGGPAQSELLVPSKLSPLPQSSIRQDSHGVYRKLVEASAVPPVPQTPARQKSPFPANTECRVFVYSKPKFPNFVTNKDLREHFCSYKPVDAYIIRKGKESTGVGVVQFFSKSVAKEVINEMEGTKVLDSYSISLKFEDPARPPKQKRKNLKAHESHRECELAEKELPKKKLPKERLLREELPEKNEIEPFFSIKVSHLSRGVTKQKLAVLFGKYGELIGDPVIHSEVRNPYARVNFKSSDAARNALELNNSPFEGSLISVKLSSKQSQGLLKKGTSLPKENTSMVMKLSHCQWNRVMTIGSEGRSLLDDIDTSVDIQPLIKEKSLKFEGDKKAVESFFSYATQHFKKEVIIQRERMEALLFLKPTLHSDIMREFDVEMTGFCEDSCKIEFDGPISNIDHAYDKFSSLEQSLLDSKVTLDSEFPAEQHDSIQMELVHDEVFLPLSCPGSSILVLYHFPGLNVAEVVSKVKSLLISTAKVPCGHEEAVFLLHCLAETKFTANISYSQENLILKGNFSAIERTKRELETILLNLHSHKVSITCKPMFESHIRESVLLPFQKLETTFCFYLDKELDVATKSVKLDIFIFCNKEQVFSDACKLLEKVQPETKEYILPDDAEEIVNKMQPKLEKDYYVCLEYRKPSLLLHGLISSNLDRCYAEVKEAIDTTVVNTKQISISKHRKKLLNKLYKRELMELEKQCSHISFGEEDSITLKGTLKQLEDVKTKLESQLLSMNVCHETFLVERESKFCGMWCSHWERLKQKNGELLLEYSRKGENSKSKLVTFEFEVIGVCDSRVKKVKQCILSKGVQKKSFTLSKEGVQALRKVIRTAKNDFLSGLVVGIDEITPWGNKVTICAPEGCDNDLDIAVEKIRKFAGDDTKMTDTISSDNSVVELILNSSKYFEPYLSAARDMAEQYHVMVSVLQGPKPKLQISGPKYSFEVAKSKIQELSIEAIEKNAGKKEIDLKFTYTPIFAMPEFFHLKSQLMDKFCVRCSIPDGNFENELISSLSVQPSNSENVVEIDIVKGNLLVETVDAIVNAANEDLQHIGGLAKAISDAGGPLIKQECDSYTARHSKLKPGEAFVSGSGCLPCKHVIHAVGPCWSGGKHNEEQVLQSAVFRSLELAESSGSVSVAIPAVGTGLFNVPVEVCALATFKATENFIRSCSINSLQNIRFVLISQSMVDTFRSCFMSFKLPTLANKPPVKAMLPTSSYS